MRKLIAGLMSVVAALSAMGDVSLPSTSTIADIQAAIDAAEPGETITLADGTYAFDQPLTIEKGITLTGSHRDKCILAGSGSSFPAVTALKLDHKDACVKNLTIADIPNPSVGDYGYHGVSVWINKGKLADSRVTGCKTSNGNRVAGVSLETDAAFMTRCMVDHNASSGGNGIGGVRIQKSGGVIDNCLVWANSGGSGDYGAGGVSVRPDAWGGKMKVINCTIVGNTAVKSGGGLKVEVSYISATEAPWIVNTIISGNTAPDGADLLFNSDNTKNLTGFNCLCPTVTYGTNPQTAAPLFVDAENGDFRLQPASKARNNGDKNKAAAALGLEDLEGMTDYYGSDRVLEGEVDIGCAEFMVDPDQPTCVIAIDKEAVVTGDDVTLTAVADGFGDAEDIVYAWQIQFPGSEARSMSGASVLLEELEFGSYVANVTVSSASLGKSAEASEFSFLVLPKTLYVTSKENPTAAAPYGTPETAATSVQDALVIAVEGATVVLDEGTHKVSDTVVVPKGVSVVGAGRDMTTIYATQEFDPVVRINGVGAQVSQLTVAHGRMKNWWNQSASGVVIGTDGGTLADCRVTDCGGTVSRIFGSVNISGGDALVTRCLIDGNFSLGDGSTCGGIVASAGRIEHCVITNNEGYASAYYGNYNGSGLCLKGAVTVLNCTIIGNRMAEGQDGSGVHVMNDNAVVRNCIIDGNLNSDGTESNYRGNGASFSYCLSSEAAPAGGTECVVGRPVFEAKRPYCLVRGTPGWSQGSVSGYEDRLMSAKDFFGNRRVKHISRTGVPEIDIGAVESRYIASGIYLMFR